MDRLHVLFLIRALAFGGAERQLVALASAMHARGHCVQVALFYGGGPLEGDLRSAGVPVFCLDKRGRWDVFGFVQRLLRLLRQEKPDVLHPYLEGANVLCALLKPLLPGVRLVWGVRCSDMELSRYHWLTRLSYRLERRLSRAADLIILNSHVGREHVIRTGYPEEKTIVVPNGIDTKRFYPDLEARRRVRAEWGVADDEKLIGRVGRFDPMKDYPGFLEAANLLARERAGVRFVCVGEGPEEYREKLKTQGKSLENRLIWAGSRADMAAVYNALDILCSSSRYGEGFPNVIGEAMACGVPCVVTDVGDSARVVGDMGVVVEKGAPEKLAQGMKQILAQDAPSLQQQSRQRIQEHFSVQQLVEKTEQALWPRA